MGSEGGKEVICHLTFVIRPGLPGTTMRGLFSSGLKHETKGDGQRTALARSGTPTGSGSASSPRCPLFAAHYPLQPLPTALSASGGPHTHSGSRQSNPGGSECKSQAWRGGGAWLVQSWRSSRTSSSLGIQSESACHCPDFLFLDAERSI